jgi:hypothetical protein
VVVVALQAASGQEQGGEELGALRQVGLNMYFASCIAQPMHLV